MHTHTHTRMHTHTHTHTHIHTHTHTHTHYSLSESVCDLSPTGTGPPGALLPPAGPPAQAHLLSLWVWGQGTHGKGEYGRGVAIRGHADPGKIFI